MHDASIVIARPQAAMWLVLLFHGVGSSAANLVPLGDSVAQAHPDAIVVSVDGPHASSLGSGREWFSVIGITEQNRPQRIAEVMPLFLQTIGKWQRESGIGPDRTVLVGFSQGAILALESTQVDTTPAAAGRVIALAGRLAVPARRAPQGAVVHLIHGEDDRVVAAGASVQAAQELSALGGQVTLDLLPGLGHGIDARALRQLLGHLRGQVQRA